MGQCRTWNADISIGCYYDDYSSCNNGIPTSLLKKFCSHLFASFFNYKLQLVIV